MVETEHWHCPVFILLSGVLYSILHSRPIPKNHYLSDLASADKEYYNTISLIKKVQQSRYRPGVAQRVPGS